MGEMAGAIGLRVREEWDWDLVIEEGMMKFLNVVGGERGDGMRWVEGGGRGAGGAVVKDWEKGIEMVGDMGRESEGKLWIGRRM